MSEQGWISLHRKLIENPIFKDSESLHLWIYLLLRASHKKTDFMMNGRIITLNRGQLVFGILSCSRDTGLTPRKIRTRLDLMKTHRFLTRQTTYSHSIITICNYDKYQRTEGGEGHTKRHTDDTLTTTYNNDNNENNKIYTQQAAEIYSAYPRKADRNNSIKSIQKLLKAGEATETLLRSVSNYKAQIESKETEREYIIQSNNFFGKAARYKEFIETQPHDLENDDPITRAIERCRERGDY